jgi:PadR family transcriptional regulator PadR
MADRAALGSFEYQLLQVLIREPNDAYGATIQERVEGKLPALGAVYTALDRLEKKGFVTSRWGEATAERGGRRKRYYRIETSGREAVRQTEAIFMAGRNFGPAMGVA